MDGTQPIATRENVFSDRYRLDVGEAVWDAVLVIVTEGIVA